MFPNKSTDNDNKALSEIPAESSQGSSSVANIYHEIECPICLETLFDGSLVAFSKTDENFKNFNEPDVFHYKCLKDSVLMYGRHPTQNILHASGDGYIVKCKTKKILKYIEESILTKIYEAIKNKDTEKLERYLKSHHMPMRNRRGRSLLFLACEENDTDTVDFLLRYGPNVNARNFRKKTPLHVAVEKGNRRLAELLMNAGAKLNIQDNNGVTPLHLACEKNDDDMVALLLEHDADVNAKTTEGCTPLHIAGMNGNVLIAELLLSARATLDITNKNTRTPLQLAILGNMNNMICYLLRCGANANIKDSQGNTLMHLIARHGSPTITKILIGRGVSLEEPNMDGDPPLNIAISENNLPMVQFFLSKKVELNPSHDKIRPPLNIAVEKNNINIAKLLLEAGVKTFDENHSDKNSPLVTAVMRKSLEMVKILCEAGADVTIGVPVRWAVMWNQIEIFKLLLECGAIIDETDIHNAVVRGYHDLLECLFTKQNFDLNSQSKKGETPLHLAAAERSVDIVRLLLNNGADVNSQSKKGETPLHIAANWMIDNVNLLLDRGAEVNVKDNKGKTPLHHAVKMCRKDIVEILLARGADKDILSNAGETALDIALKRNNEMALDIALRRNNEIIANLLLDAPKVKNRNDDTAEGSSSSQTFSSTVRNAINSIQHGERDIKLMDIAMEELFDFASKAGKLNIELSNVTVRLSPRASEVGRNGSVDISSCPFIRCKKLTVSMNNNRYHFVTSLPNNSTPGNEYWSSIENNVLTVSYNPSKEEVDKTISMILQKRW